MILFFFGKADNDDDDDDDDDDEFKIKYALRTIGSNACPTVYDKGIQQRSRQLTTQLISPVVRRQQRR